MFTKEKISTFVAVFFVLTIVTSVEATAMPDRSAPTDTQKNVVQRNHESQTKILTKTSAKFENLSVAPAPGPIQEPKADIKPWSHEFRRETYFYPYQHELIPFVGANDTIQDSTGNLHKIYFAAGLTYVFPSVFDRNDSNMSARWEGGAEFSAADREQFWIARRHVFYPNDAFRPYYSLGVMHNLVPSQQLASFSNWDNYLARMAIGFEDVITPPRSVQFELVGAAGTKDIFVLATCGISWGF